jgi:outer membrane protein assembly factor BamE
MTAPTSRFARLRLLKQCVALAALTLALAGCESSRSWVPALIQPYRPDVQQGNVVTREMVEQLREGMSREQVRFLLGTPMLPDAFDRDRWDYLYYLKVGRLQKAEEQRLTIYFTDEKVSRIENVGAPTEVPTTEPPATEPPATEAPAASATPAAATP